MKYFKIIKSGVMVRFKPSLLISFIFILVGGVFFSKELLAENIIKKINQKVPFVSQAPLGEWSDPRQQDSCEEAVVLMSMAWAKDGIQIQSNIDNTDKNIKDNIDLGSQNINNSNSADNNLYNFKNLSLADWRDKLVAMSDFQQEKYGEYRDASLEDIEIRLFRDYFSYEKTKIKDVLSPKDIILELEKGNLVLIPANGQALKNPNFTSPGPERHMVLIKGYDYETKEFITNDPGTRNGADYRYKEKLLFEAIRPYKTGYHEPF